MKHTLSLRHGSRTSRFLPAIIGIASATVLASRSFATDPTLVEDVIAKLTTQAVSAGQIGLAFLALVAVIAVVALARKFLSKPG